MPSHISQDYATIHAEFYSRFITNKEPLPAEWTELDGWNRPLRCCLEYKGCDFLNPLLIGTQDEPPAKKTYSSRSIYYYFYPDDSDASSQVSAD